MKLKLRRDCAGGCLVWQNSSSMDKVQVTAISDIIPSEFKKGMS